MRTVARVLLLSVQRDAVWAVVGDDQQVMDENCTMRPCATDFSIAAIMSRHGRAKTRCRDRSDPADNLSPLGKECYWFNL